jgi:hypothetical protein
VMHFRLFEDDDETPVLELDDEAIDYLEDGLRDLRDKEPGEGLTSPSLVSNDGEVIGVGVFELRRK